MSRKATRWRLERVGSMRDTALRELSRVRQPLLRELERLQRDPDYLKGQPSHLCCTRQFNQMRISPLEAHAIARAFLADSELRKKLPAVLDRLRAELVRLKDNDQRQGFDCPLLDGTSCLVHRAAKPIGCVAWHPRGQDSRGEGRSYTAKGWRAFAERDRLNDRLYGRDWKLRVVPLWLKRVFARQLTGKAELRSRTGVAKTRTDRREGGSHV